MVQNEQDQARAGGVSRHGKVLRDFKSDLIRIGTGNAVTPGPRGGGYAGDRCRICRRSEGAFRLGKGRNQVVEALTREPELHVADIFSGAANDNFFFIIRKARRLHLGDPDCHSLPSPWGQPDAVDLDKPDFLGNPQTLAKQSGLCHGQTAFVTVKLQVRALRSTLDAAGPGLPSAAQDRTIWKPT